MNKENAFSGLESAIILIAFVVVATIFAYVTLGAGFFASEKAQTVTQQSTKEASAVMYTEGAIYGELYPLTDGTYPGQLKTIKFTLKIPDTGLSQDLKYNIIIYTQYDDQGNIVYSPRTYSFGGATAHDLYFGVENGDTDPVMQPGEGRIFTLTDLAGPVPGGYFTIETKPKNGNGAFIQKFLPAAYDGGVIL